MRRVRISASVTRWLLYATAGTGLASARYAIAPPNPPAPRPVSVEHRDLAAAGFASGAARANRVARLHRRYADRSSRSALPQRRGRARSRRCPARRRIPIRGRRASDATRLDAIERPPGSGHRRRAAHHVPADHAQLPRPRGRQPGGGPVRARNRRVARPSPRAAPARRPALGNRPQIGARHGRGSRRRRRPTPCATSSTSCGSTSAGRSRRSRWTPPHERTPHAPTLEGRQ